MMLKRLSNVIFSKSEYFVESKKDDGVTAVNSQFNFSKARIWFRALRDERAFELNSAGDSENRERIGLRKDPCAMVKARWPGISTAMISTLEHVENRERIGLRKDGCAMAKARWSGFECYHFDS